MPRGIEAKSVTKKDTKFLRHYGTKVVSEINSIKSSNLQQYEPKQSLSIVIPSDSEGIQSINNLIQLQGISINSTETDQTSMPLGVFASESVSCRIGVLKLLLARNCHSYCCRRYEFRSSLPELATRPQFRKSDLHKKSAFTLAEVLITLGIIGVVAALTIPNVVSNYKKKVVETRLAKLYSVLNQAVELSEEKNGACTTWEWGDVDKARNSEFLEYWWKTYMADYIPNVDSVKTPNNSGSTGGYMVFFKDGTGLRIEAIVSQYIWVVIYVNPKFNKQKFVSGAYRDLVSMVSGRDYFSLYLWPERGCSFDLHFYNNLSRSELIEGCKNPYPYGAHCLYLIKNNGWKIPDDYPIKF